MPSDKNWHRKRYIELIKPRRPKWIKDNGPCVKCGSIKQLEVDHIERNKKISHNVWTWGEKRRSEELKKCQVLCKICHKRKTNKELYKPRKHGTATMYTSGKCRCILCKNNWAKYRQEYRKRTGKR